jgi:beta-glucosidase
MNLEMIMPSTTDRRTFIGGAAALAALPTLAAAQGRGTPTATFPKGFLWGAATAAHQIEGNNTNSDNWVVENVKPTIYTEPSLDAANSFEMWPVDLDLVKRIGLNTYRFSLEWARIEPLPGVFSIAMLDHYKTMIEGCRTRGLTPIVTFNHFTTPVWFAAMGGWTNAESPRLFARYCERATRHLGVQIGYATTLNEPNIPFVLEATLADFVAPFIPVLERTTAAARKAVGSDRFVAANLMGQADARASLPNMIAAHKAGRAAIKSVRPDLPVGVSLAIGDDQAVGSTRKRDQVRSLAYGPWLEAAKGDDFLGVQNYGRNQWNERGDKVAPITGKRDINGGEVYPPSLAGAVRYAHEATGCPIMVTEHGVGTSDDTIRAELIPAALTHLRSAMNDGVPVIGYMHWSLIDNYEWIFGYKPQFGLCSVDRKTFKRTPKPSAAVYGTIARRNAV